MSISDTFSHNEIRRYSRHLVLPEVGLEGQKKIKDASILLIGAGGLGSPLAMYLAAAGIGKLGLVDFDVIEESNLQRQVIHSTENIGQSELKSAKDFISGINPNVSVECFETAFTSENALEIAEPYDILIDGTDNFPTRYLANDVCVLLKIPNIYGSIYRFDGQASIFWAGKGPCYRCIYPDPPPPDLIPSCAEGGVLGILPGVIGLIQATEAIKLIIGKGDLLLGRLLLYDALQMSFREVKIRKDPECPICGANPTIKKLIDYEQFCGTPISSNTYSSKGQLSEITAEELHLKLENNSVFLLDVREPEELLICNITGSALIPIGQLPERMSEIDGTKEIIAYCRTGKRSAKALQLLHDAGYTSAKHLKGGIIAWIDEVDGSMPKY